MSLYLQISTVTPRSAGLAGDYAHSKEDNAEYKRGDLVDQAATGGSFDLRAGGGI
jgi:hypothetical protein